MRFEPSNHPTRGVSPQPPRYPDNASAACKPCSRMLENPSDAASRASSELRDSPARRRYPPAGSRRRTVRYRAAAACPSTAPHWTTGTAWSATPPCRQRALRAAGAGCWHERSPGNSYIWFVGSPGCQSRNRDAQLIEPRAHIVRQEDRAVPGSSSKRPITLT